MHRSRLGLTVHGLRAGMRSVISGDQPLFAAIDPRIVTANERLAGALSIATSRLMKSPAFDAGNRRIVEQRRRAERRPTAGDRKRYCGTMQTGCKSSGPYLRSEACRLPARARSFSAEPRLRSLERSCRVKRQRTTQFRGHNTEPPLPQHRLKMRVFIEFGSRLCERTASIEGFPKADDAHAAASAP